MISVLADASLPGLVELFPKPFKLTTYHKAKDVASMLQQADVLVCRSTLRVDSSILNHTAIQCVATASSGTDHIDKNYLEQRNIALFDAKGSNAHAVADYVVTTIAALRQLHTSLNLGLKAGVIGVGEVGGRVVKRLQAIGFDVICYDPLKAHEAHRYRSMPELTDCDLLCLHPNLHDSHPFPSRHLINASFLNQLKPYTVIINASRGDVVNEDALLKSNSPLVYCTDVYLKEPFINSNIVDFSTICTPHIAGHSIDAKQRAVVEISRALHQKYGLVQTYKDETTPTCSLLEHEDHDLSDTSWENQVLSIYNPMHDTQQLKAAHDKTEAFIRLRKEHQKRHDFNQYWTETKQHQLIFGYQ